MVIFFIKMSIGVIPLFSIFDSKIAASVIMQLEQETKSEKDGLEKDATKEKKVFDEQLYASFHYNPIFLESSHLHTLEKSLLVQLYHPVVPTPPPNV